MLVLAQEPVVPTLIALWTKAVTVEHYIQASKACYLQQLVPDNDQHRAAEKQQGVVSTLLLTEQRVPQADAVREGELLSQQQRDPSKRVELGIDLQETSSITSAVLTEGRE